MPYICQPIANAACFTIDRAELLPVLSFLAGSIVERRNTIPILSNVRICADGDGTLTLSATDLDIEARFTLAAVVEAPGCFTVDAAALADVVKAADAGAVVTLRANDGRVHVTSGRARHSLSTLPHDDMPRLREPSGAVPCGLEPETFAADLARLAPFVGKSEARYYLNGVEIAADAEAFTMTATDGSRMARMTREPIAGADALPASFILPRKVVTALGKLLKRKPAAVTIAVAGMRGLIRMPGIEIVAKMVDGTFPDCGALVDETRAAGLDPLPMFDLEPALGDAAVEAYRKALGAMPTIESGPRGFVLFCDAVPGFVGMVARASEAKCRYSYELGNYAAAREYLYGLAGRYGLPIAALADDDGKTPATMHAQSGRVRGMTYGRIVQYAVKAGQHHWRQELDAEAYEAALAAYRVENGEGADFPEGEVYEMAQRDIPDQYAPGSFSVIMPREHACMAASVVFEDEAGNAHPLRIDGSGKLELSAHAIRRLAGDDLGEMREIAPLRVYRGRVLQSGEFMPAAPRIAKGSDALRMTAAEMTAYAKACQPMNAPIAADVIERAALQPGDVVLCGGEPLAVVSRANGRAVLSDGTALAPAGRPMRMAPVEAPECPAEAVGVVSERAEPENALEARLEALEAIVARLARPVVEGRPARSEAERRAIVRAWRMRGELRAARVEIIAERERAEEAFHRAAVASTDAIAAAGRERLALERVAAALADREAYAAGAANADRRAMRMVRVAADHRRLHRRAMDDLAGSRAEARALARRLEQAPTPRGPSLPVAPARTRVAA